MISEAIGESLRHRHDKIGEVAGGEMILKATDAETEYVREYFEWQAPDLEVIFLQKVYSEAVLNTRHDVWDIHTNQDRWWVITGGGDEGNRAGTHLTGVKEMPAPALAVDYDLAW